MIINVISLPVVETALEVVTGCLRCFDRGCTFNYNKTKKKTQEEWEKLYTGPEFLIEFRYSQVTYICIQI